MPKQRVFFQRVETIEVEFDVLADPVTRATAEAIINMGQGGTVGDRTSSAKAISRETSPWVANSSAPKFCECAQPAPRGPKPAKQGRR